ncbi:hypothetical protein Droror1_Dr00011737 [Drosera rotundifolia]
MASLSFSLSLSAPKTLISPPNFPSPHLNPNLNLIPKLKLHSPSLKNSFSNSRLCVVATAATAEAEAEAGTVPDVFARKLYVGNIPRDLDNEGLRKVVEEHGEVEKVEVMYDKYTERSRRFAFVTMKTVDDANATIEKLNGTEIGGRKIAVNITEKPLLPIDPSSLEGVDQYIGSPHKVYVGNLKKTVTADKLKSFFSSKGKVLSAKVMRVPATKSKFYGFVTFASEEEADAVISSFNNAELEGQPIRLNSAK